MIAMQNRHGRIWVFAGGEGTVVGFQRNDALGEIFTTPDEALVVAEGLIRASLGKSSPGVREALMKVVMEEWP